MRGQSPDPASSGPETEYRSREFGATARGRPRTGRGRRSGGAGEKRPACGPTPLGGGTGDGRRAPVSPRSPRSGASSTAHPGPGLVPVAPPGVTETPGGATARRHPRPHPSRIHRLRPAANHDDPPLLASPGARVPKVAEPGATFRLRFSSLARVAPGPGRLFPRISPRPVLDRPRTADYNAASLSTEKYRGHGRLSVRPFRCAFLTFRIDSRPQAGY